MGCFFSFTEITAIQGHYTNVLHGARIPCLSLGGSKGELSAFSLRQDNLFFLNLVVNHYVILHSSFMFTAFPSI